MNNLMTTGLILFLLAMSMVCCKTSAKTPDRPNIIWLIAEDISPALGCYGDDYAITPNIDKLAKGGLVYDFALTTAPICAPSRSGLVTGIYATSLGTQHLRCDIPFPKQLKTLPELLRANGYFTSNRDKTDYNFSPDGLWEHWSSEYAPWRHRKDNQPFYSFMNIGPSHEGSVNDLERYTDFVKDLPAEVLHNPDNVPLPPYFPDTPKIREVWAHYYDILTVLDQNVGNVIQLLKEDGLMEETIIFFMADHGFGMPRYKRWLNKTGMNVPMVVHVPEKYRHLVKDFKAGGHKSEMVSFIDMVPTTLSLAGVAVPETMPGKPIMGVNAETNRKLAFGARDRADDMYEMSRSVCDGRFFYVRHYMPHLPYIQTSYIFYDQKESFREMRKQYKAGNCNAEQAKLWNKKPLEELYDLQNDPQELNNLAADKKYASVKSKLKNDLHNWMIESKDLGLLPEPEYMIRSENSTPYEYACLSGKYQVEKILDAAEMVGVAGEKELLLKLNDEDSGVRFWAVIGLMQLNQLNSMSMEAFNTLLSDSSPSVQIAAAEALCTFSTSDKALETLGKWVQDDRPWLSLQAARSIALVGEEARPLIPLMYKVLDKHLAEPGAKNRYKGYNFEAFISWALEWALYNMNEDILLNGRYSFKTKE
ncbi:sulfatase-like hydrolase/transferase [uncultured Draconibacterium sp.]|uniref:sulfatase-like hydrolase/transferase n=1 Tax=uncultured Draconibacterium sp. TaxID=1573823 RepID=UPI0029C7EF92|nr:sulfatase-like hydrolase/transferase [uncultured Draconibacterium sp.]